MTRKRGVLVPATVPFWLKPSSTFGLFSATMFIERSPGFAIPSILVPLRRGAVRYIGPSRFRCQPVGCGSIVRRPCTSRYLPAHLRRIPLMGQQVWSILHARQSTLRSRVAVPPSHGAFQGHAAHPIERSTELRPKGSTDACTPVGVFHIPIC